MVFDEYFLTIPIYRLKEDKYYSDMEIAFEKSISNSWDQSFIESNPGLVRDCKSSQHTRYGGGWEYNEIVGYIKLHFLGTQVRGEYWGTIPKRKVKTRRKQFEYKAHKLAAEVGIREKNSEGILNAVEEYIERCKREVKNRHLDLREFDNIKNHIDWVSLYSENNPFA